VKKLHASPLPNQIIPNSFTHEEVRLVEELKLAFNWANVMEEREDSTIEKKMMSRFKLLGMQAGEDLQITPSLNPQKLGILKNNHEFYRHFLEFKGVG